jgi:hypothetical protein
MNDSTPTPEKQPSEPVNDGWIESCNASNVETVIVEGGAGDNTIRPMPEWIRPYIDGWVPRPERPPRQDG